MINIKNLDLNKIKIDEAHINILIYYIEHATQKSVKLLYLIINKLKGCTEKRNENKYLTVASSDESKDTLTKY